MFFQQFGNSVEAYVDNILVKTKSSRDILDDIQKIF